MLREENGADGRLGECSISGFMIWAGTGSFPGYTDPPCAVHSRRNKATPLTRKSDQLVLPARLANQSQKPLGWNPTIEELVELPLDEAWNVPVLLGSRARTIRFPVRESTLVIG